MENASYDDDWLLMPRATLSYVPDKHFQLSAMLGRYSQTADDDNIVMSGKNLAQSTANHAILSMQYYNILLHRLKDELYILIIEYREICSIS